MNELLIRSTTREPKSHWLTSKYLEEDTQPITKAYKDTSKKLKGLKWLLELYNVTEPRIEEQAVTHLGKRVNK